MHPQVVHRREALVIPQHCQVGGNSQSGKPLSHLCIDSFRDSGFPELMRTFRSSAGDRPESLPRTARLVANASQWTSGAHCPCAAGSCLPLSTSTSNAGHDIGVVLRAISSHCNCVWQNVMSASVRVAGSSTAARPMRSAAALMYPEFQCGNAFRRHSNGGETASHSAGRRSSAPAACQATSLPCLHACAQTSVVGKLINSLTLPAQFRDDGSPARLATYRAAAEGRSKSAPATSSHLRVAPMNTRPAFTPSCLHG